MIIPKRPAPCASNHLSFAFKVGFGMFAASIFNFSWAQPVVSVINPAPSQSIMTGQAVTMSVSSSTPGVAYQWRMDGTNILGATAATYSMPAAGTMDSGSYDVVLSGAGGSTTMPMGTLVMSPSDAKLINISARGMAGMGAAQMIMGFVSQGDTSSANQSVLLRGMGPSLAGMMGGGGMMQGSTTLTNPVLTVYDGSSRMMGENMGWTTAPTTATGAGASTIQATMQSANMGMMSSLGAFAPTSTSDSALMMTVPAGGYTTIVSGNANATGLVLAECYDADALSNGSSASHIVNMSARTYVGSGNNALIGGFVISPGPSGASATVLLRAMGASLAMFGVTGSLAAPTMTLYDGNSKPIATNAVWTAMPTVATGSTASPVHAGIEAATMAAMTRVGAFAPKAGGADSGMIATLPPGNYSVVVSGQLDSSGTPMTGVAMFEIYLIR